MYNDPYSKDPQLYNKLVKELYEKWPDVSLSPEYSELIQENQISLLVRLARYKFAGRMLTNSDRVLEVGCSTGVGTIFLGQMCESVLGIDVKQDDIDRANNLNKRGNVRFERLDLFELSPDKKFDAVISLDAIEHMEEKQGLAFVEKCARLISSQGMVLIGTPSWFVRDYQNALSKAAHIRMYKLEELNSLVGNFFSRTFRFCMNDEIVHTGNPKMAWYYFVIGVCPKVNHG